MADGTIAGRHDPQGRQLRRTPCATACGRAHILDGRIPHVLLLEIFTDAGIGTMVTRPKPRRRHRRGRRYRMTAHAFDTTGLDALPVHAGVRRRRR